MTEQRSNSEFQEILARLRILQEATGGKAPVIPLIDPTANVIALQAASDRRQDDLRAAEFKRQDDLRTQAEHFNDKFAAERLRADGEARHAESGRIDALLVANTNSVALALAKQEAQAQAQDKRIAALEQNQYQGVGAGAQRTEGRQRNEWVVGIIIGIVVALAGILSHLFGK